MNWKGSIAAGSLVAIHLILLGARFFAPYDPATQHRDLPFAPPMRLHLVDSQGKVPFRPFVYGWKSQAGAGGTTYAEDRTQAWPLRFFVRSQGGSLRLFGVDAPGYVFLLGTDDFGRDQFSRLLFGGQVSLFAGLLATVLSLSIGLLLGGISGYFGSWLDDTIMRGSEIFMALPWIYLLFGVRAFLPLHLEARQTFVLLIAVVGITGWARPSRLIRGIVLSVKQRAYIQAARAFGASPAYILRRHVLPETSAVVLTQGALLVPQYILAEVTLSFLGLGIGEPTPSWGNMLAGLQRYYVLESYPWMYAAGLALVPILLLYYWVANALQRNLARGES